MEYPKFKVCCRCFTFNHSKYIIDAMNGFTMQQTSFPFVCCIVDDASTDGEQDVIRKYVEDNFDFSEGSVSYHKETDYAHITYAQHKTNKNCYFAVLYLKENHYSQSKPKMEYLSEWRDICEYEALCEGDDYWIDPNKISDQYNFLNVHDDYRLVHTLYETVDSFGNELELKDALYSGIEYRIKDGFIWHYYLTQSGFILTCTVMIRVSCVNDEKKYIDHGLFMQIARNTKVFCIRKKMSAYRYTTTGAMRSNHGKVQQAIRDASFMQLYYLYNNKSYTNSYYLYNLNVFIHIVYFFSKYLIYINQITIPNKYHILLNIIVCNPFLLIFSPVAILIGVFNKFIHLYIINRY